MNPGIKQFYAIRGILLPEEKLFYSEMALISGNTHKTAYTICANVVRKADRVIGVHVRSHAGVRVHVPVYRDDAGVDE
jgi:hypothetical protein